MLLFGLLLFSTAMSSTVNGVPTHVETAQSTSDSSVSFHSDNYLSDSGSELQRQTQPDEFFVLGDDQQLEFYTAYSGIIDRVSSGEDKKTFLHTLIDTEQVRRFSSGIVQQHKAVVIDVGGSYLKIATVELEQGDLEGGTGESANAIPEAGDNRTARCRVKVDSENYQYPLQGQGVDHSKVNWYDWVAEQVQKHFENTEIGTEHAALTFSYPIDQISLSSAKITSVCKQWIFSRSDRLFRRDIVKKLNRALMCRGLKFRVNCVLNDAVSTYIAGLFYDKTRTQISMILGTGTNGSFEIRFKDQSGTRLINAEWARTAVNGDILTGADKRVLGQLDETGLSYQTFEVITAGYKFADIVKEQLRMHFSHDQAILSQIQKIELQDLVGNSKRGRFTAELRACMKQAVLSYKRRASKLLAAILLAISDHVSVEQSDEIIVTMNGSVLKNTIDQKLLDEELMALTSLLGRSYSFTLVYRESASLVGAAMTSLSLKQPCQNVHSD